MCKKLDLMAFKKGQVWMMSGVTWTKEQHESGIICGDRPVIIYNAISINRNFVHVIPCTTNTEFSNGVELKLEVGCNSSAPPQNLMPVPTNNLTMFLGTLDDEKMAEIDDAVLVYFGLKQDNEIKERVFKYTKDHRSTFFDKGCPAPIRNKIHIINSDNVIIEKAENETTNDVVIAENTTVTVDEPVEETKLVISKRRAPFDINSLSIEDKKFFTTAKVKDVAERFNIGVSTVYNIRKRLNTVPTMTVVSHSGTEKKSTPPKIVSDYKHRNKTYKKFATKKIAKLTFDEKRLFTQLDSCKLSTVMNVPLNVICTAQQSFKEELGL